MLNKLAPEMVRSVSAIVGYAIIITDHKGIIIGSTDETRLGTLHEPSLQVIKKRKQESHDSNKTKFFRNVKPGTTLPIEFAGKVIGSVAIAGDPVEVSKYGMLVKTQVEILLKEQIFFNTSVLKEIALQNLIHELSVFDSKYSDDFYLLTRGNELGYDLKSPHTALIFDLKYNNPHLSKVLKQNKIKSDTVVEISRLKHDILATFGKVFNNRQHIITFTSNNTVVVLFALNYSYKEQEAIQLLKQKCCTLLKHLDQDEINAIAGIGRIAKNLSNLSRSYKDAWQAVTLCRKLLLETKIAYISDFSVQQLLLNIPKEIGDRFCENALNDLTPQPDWPELKRTIIAWCESSFSLTKTSLALKVHRHTVIYRLNKIEQITKTNLRDCFPDILSLYLAIMVNNLTGSSTDKI